MQMDSGGWISDPKGLSGSITMDYSTPYTRYLMATGKVDSDDVRLMRHKGPPRPRPKCKPRPKLMSAPILFSKQKMCAERRAQIRQEYEKGTGTVPVILDGFTREQYLAPKTKKDKARQSWIATASTGGEVLATIGG